MPFAPGYTRTKSFAALGDLLPVDLNSIQDDLGGALVHRAPLQPVSTLPSSPTDGQEAIYQNAAMVTLGVAWRFKYRAGSASAYKWEFIGGSRLYNEIATAQATANSAYGDLATVGPTVVVPLAGEYLVAIGAVIEASLTTSWRGRISSSSSDADAAVMSGSGNGASNAEGGAAWREQSRLAVPAAATLTMKYRSDAANSVSFSQRVISIQPIRVA